ncbi:hypothetical protein ACLOJK_008225 [Asimina triloba]
MALQGGSKSSQRSSSYRAKRKEEKWKTWFGRNSDDVELSLPHHAFLSSLFSRSAVFLHCDHHNLHLFLTSVGGVVVGSIAFF